MNETNIFWKAKLGTDLKPNTEKWQLGKEYAVTGFSAFQPFMRLSQICYLLFEIEPLSSSLMLYGRCRKSESDQIRSDQSLSRVRLCDPMNRSTPGLPVHHQLPEFTETHVHRINGKVMYLLLNMLSRLVITFLPRSKRLFISWDY